MNIFFLSLNPKKAAEYHCDKHVVKMILESAQLLSTAHHIADPKSWISPYIYNPTHINHPSAIWTRSNANNYQWLHSLATELCYEYTYRYNKIHASQNMIDSYLVHTPNSIEHASSLDTIPMCMPVEIQALAMNLYPSMNHFTNEFRVLAYRLYYAIAKKEFVKYTGRLEPIWYTNLIAQNLSVNN